VISRRNRASEPILVAIPRDLTGWKFRWLTLRTRVLERLTGREAVAMVDYDVFTEILLRADGVDPMQAGRMSRVLCDTLNRAQRGDLSPQEAWAAQGIARTLPPRSADLYAKVFVSLRRPHQPAPESQPVLPRSPRPRGRQSRRRLAATARNRSPGRQADDPDLADPLLRREAVA
jgi:hypothetical protein